MGADSTARGAKSKCLGQTKGLVPSWLEWLVVINPCSFQHRSKFLLDHHLAARDLSAKLESHLRVLSRLSVFADWNSGSYTNGQNGGCRALIDELPMTARLGKAIHQLLLLSLPALRFSSIWRPDVSTCKHSQAYF